jgi:hypothetical protein
MDNERFRIFRECIEPEHDLHAIGR